MRFEETYGDWEGGRLTQAEAALLLGVSEVSVQPPNLHFPVVHAVPCSMLAICVTAFLSL